MTRTRFALVLTMALVAAPTAAQELSARFDAGTPASRPAGARESAVVVPRAGAGIPAARSTASRLDEIIGRVQQSEATMIASLRNLGPVVEVYIQNLDPSATLGLVPTSDAYALGRFDWREGPRLSELSGERESPDFRGASKNKGVKYVADGFVAMAAPDWQFLNLDRYAFRLVRREFIGETRCYVLDVQPKDSEQDGFSGRIWVEDRGYNIVRFNGINRRLNGFSVRRRSTFNVDSWRTNVLPGLWLPSYVYVEETGPVERHARDEAPRFRGHVRLWGYDARQADSIDEFTAIRIDETGVLDGGEAQLSPALGQRRWEQEAEANILERLEQTSLLAADGDVERVLETVINNLVVTSDLHPVRQVRARVLLTSPIESFTVGHTIVLSRGLIDVLPDEASLAMVLAHELSHIALGHRVVNTEFAFASRMRVDDLELLDRVRIEHGASEEAAADARAATMLQRSPYAGKLAAAGLFLKFVQVNAGTLASLIQPHFGGRFAHADQVAAHTLLQAAPELDPLKLDQLPALPLGARLLVDPWSRKLQLVRSIPDSVASVREKGPLAVTPLAPFLKYAEMEPAAPRQAAEGYNAAR
ncbi:MAG: hypothetical protein FJW23_14220 [Acidimicrobiia bacterium]|nr:hypothetical protein [Acidimicrobiia bacterium]